MTFRATVETVFSQSKGKLPEEMTIPQLCLQTGWTYFEVLATPTIVIDRMVMLLNAKSDAEKRQNKNGK